MSLFRIVAVFSFMLLFAGCASQKFPANFPSRLKPIVKSELRESKRFEVSSITEGDDRWRVTVWCLPKTPGGHCIIEISKTNNAVIRVLLGQ